jgi:hypothetical protein
MAGKRYDTYCGIYCGACEIMLAQGTPRARTVARTFRVPPGLVACDGCKTEKPFSNCARCQIRSCARDKGVEFCCDCGDYPCQRHRDLTASSASRPHLKTCTASLQQIRDRGVSDWMERQAKTWQCPGCAAAFSWYMTDCPRCGKDLSGLREYES